MTAKVRRIPRLPMNLYGKYKRPCNLRGQGSAIHGDILQGVPAQIQAALTRGTKPFEKAVQEIPADKTVWYELPAQAVEIKTAVVGFCSYSGYFYL